MSLSAKPLQTFNVDMRKMCLFFSPECIQSFNLIYRENYLSELGRAAFTRMLAEKFGAITERFVEFVKVVTVPTQSSKLFVDAKLDTLKPNDLSDPRLIYLYFVECRTKDNVINFLGGIQGTSFVQNAQLNTIGSQTSPGIYLTEKKDEHWKIRRRLLNPEKMRDPSIEQLIARKRARYDVKADFDMNLCLSADSEPEYMLDELLVWMRNRFEALKCICKESRSTVTDQTKGSNYRTIMDEKLFCGVAKSRRRVMDHASHMSLCGYSFLVSDNEPMKTWFISQEMTLYRFRLDKEYPGEDEVESLIKSNGIKFRIARKMDQRTLSDCMALFRLSFPYEDPPKKWYEIPATECTEGVSSYDYVIKKGIAYASYVHLKKFHLPSMFKSALEERVHSKSMKNAQMNFLNDSIDTNFVDVLREGQQIVNELETWITSEVNKRRKPVGDIEDSVRNGILAPCTMWLHKRLINQNHLHYEDRFEYTSMLLDVGYDGQDVLKHLWEYFKKGGTQWEVFQKKYANVIDRKRIPPLGRNCAKLQSMSVDSKDSTSNCVGCPFKFLQVKELKLFLKTMGVKEEALAGITSHLNDNSDSSFSDACSDTFAHLHGLALTTMFRHNRPDRYYFNAVQNRAQSLKMMENQDHKIEIEYEYDSSENIVNF